jgi:hypothetical protein
MVSKHEFFKAELRELLGKYITPSSTFVDYMLVTTELDEEKLRLDIEAEKFPEEEINESIERALRAAL